jgi:protein kinase X
MLAGIDPFNDEDPMIIYQNILKGRLKFPSGFDSDAKSLVKHLLVADLSSRYGNLKNGKNFANLGVNDIKKHRFLNTINFNNLYLKKISPPYKPVVKSASDTSNFAHYDDSNSELSAAVPSENPFRDWE